MKPHDPNDVRPLVATESGFLRDLLASADADQPRDRDLDGLTARLGPLFSTALPGAAAAGGVKAATKLALVKGALKSMVTVKAAIVVAAVATTSGGAYVVVRHRAAPVVVAPAPSSTEVAPLLPPIVTAAPAASSAATDLDDVAPAPTAKKSRAPRSPSTDPAEFDLVARGGNALIAHRAPDALALANEHARRFPSGEHAEDRERIAIEALVDLGRVDEAKARARRFFARYPGSAYRPRIEGLVPSAR